MKSLGYLDLESNQIRDISPLSSLTELECLWLRGNQVSDLSPLSGLKKLNTLDLSGNPVGSLSSLTGLTSLSWLELDDCGVAEIDALAGLTQMNFLELAGNGITDITALSGLTNLTFLNLDDNEISDLTPLSGMTGMLHLSLSNNLVRDISPIYYMTALEYLDLTGNGVVSYWPLEGMSIETLYVDEDYYGPQGAWQISVTAVNTTEGGTDNYSTLPKSSTVYFHIAAYGPSGGDINLYYELIEPSGNRSENSFDETFASGDTGWVSWWYNNPDSGRAGYLTVRFYDASGNFLGSGSVYLE